MEVITTFSPVDSVYPYTHPIGGVNNDVITSYYLILTGFMTTVKNIHLMVNWIIDVV